MRKGLNRALAMLLTLAMMLTMLSIPAMAEDETPEVKVGVTCTLGMFRPVVAEVTVNEDATVTATFTTDELARSYPKIALIEQTATEEEKEAVAIEASNISDKNQCTFTITIPVEKLGEAIPISHYQNYKNELSWKNWTAQQYITVENTVDVVNQLIELIYVQERDEFTDRMCAQAKKSWDALTDEEKDEVEEADYYGADNGDASLDNPRNQDEIGEKELLVVSFGTSFNDSRVATIGAVENALEAAYPDYSVRRAFTAQIIINHIQSRDNEVIDNVQQAMERAVANGVKELVVQPTHLMYGFEYDEMKAEIDKYASKFESITYAAPLCATANDKAVVAEAVAKAAVADAGMDESALSKADADTAFVFMGHGTAHAAQETYALVQDTLTAKGYTNCFIGTVEGEPEFTEVNEVVETIKSKGYTKVILRPLMVVAGDHANNDMAGDDEDSWKSIFEAAGFTVDCQIAGLGEIEALQQLYVKHTGNAINGIIEADLEDGEYVVDVKSNSSMFNIAEEDNNTAKLTVKDGKKYITVRLNGEGYTKLFVGSLEEANAAGEDAGVAYTVVDGKYSFTIEVENLGNVHIQSWAAKSERWIDRVLTFTNPVSAGPTVEEQLEEAQKQIEELQQQLEAAQKAAEEAQAKYDNMVAIHKVTDKSVTSVKATAGSKHTVAVSWKKLAGATKYYVYRSTKSGSGFKKVATTSKLKYTVKGQKKGKTYYFKVKASVKVAGKTYYSKYSKVVKVKAK